MTDDHGKPLPHEPPTSPRRAEGGRWRMALESAELGVWDADLVSGHCYYSPSWKRMLGYGVDELGDDGELWLTLLHPDDRERAVESGNRHFAGETDRIETEFRLRHRLGHWVWVLDRGRIVEWDGAGRPTRAIGVQTDITPQKEAERQLALLNERLRITLESIGDAVISTDVQNRITFTNLAAERLLQRSEAELVGAPMEAVFSLVDEESDAVLPSSSRRAMTAGQVVDRAENAFLVRADGTRRSVRDLASPVVDPLGAVVGSVVVVQDITSARTLQRELLYAAHHDSLTGLLNRAAFEASLAFALSSGRADEASAAGGLTGDRLGATRALLYIDLDRFKMINDTIGHAAGDDILKSVAATIRSVLPQDAVVGRLGGDEFAAVVTVDDGDGAAVLASRLVSEIGKRRLHWAGRSHEIGASIGVALLDASVADLETALARADSACYAAKAEGRNRASIYTARVGAAQRNLAEIQAASGLNDAIAEGRLLLYGQEIRDLGDPAQPRRHIEILCRIAAADGSVIPPGQFIPAAERFGLMGAVDRWIIAQALERHGPSLVADPHLSIAINLSANTLSEPDLWPFVERMLAATAVAPSSLAFEITETAAVNNFTAAEIFIAQARKAGCGISLDDFGSGLSSFGYLQRFDVGSIKIDGSFIENLVANSFDRSVVAAIGTIARELGVDLVAERIEDAQTVAVLKDLGVRYGQGFFFHRPEPLANLLSPFRLQTRASPG